MNSLISIILISVGLSLDAFSVSIAGGMTSQRSRFSHAFKVAVWFGLFHILMPLIGWILGEALKGFISATDHWVAFILLSAIGLKMISESLSKDDSDKKDITSTKTLLILSVAVSIDALIIGITFSLLKLPFLIGIGTIGLTAFILSFLGFLFGKKLGAVFGKKVELLGGVTLIIIGAKILIEHLAT